MSRLLKNIVWGTFLALFVSCSGDQTNLDLTVKDLPSGKVVLKRQNLSGLEVMDTLTLDASGKYSYGLDVKEGDPDIYYLFYNDKKIASMIVRNQDMLSVVTDTLGNFSVFGSQEAEKFAQVEKDYAAAQNRMYALNAQLQNADEQQANQIQQDMAKEYVSYCRSRIMYIMENPTSLSCIPVVYQSFGEGLPVFGQLTDAIHINNLAESLSQAYPQSRYVKALLVEASRRMGQLELQNRLSLAEEIGFPDIVLTDLSGVERKLSETGKKVVLLHFWTSKDAAQKMANLETLLPVYEEFSSKGFEIYQVALDVDKAYWARVVKAQNLPWINVCDSHGSASPYVTTYNLKQVPSTFLICDGELVSEPFSDKESLRKILRKRLQ